MGSRSPLENAATIATRACAFIGNRNYHDVSAWIPYVSPLVLFR